MAVAAAIIAALVTGVATVAGTSMSVGEQEKAREEARGLADIKRADTLAAQRESAALTKEGLAVQRRGQNLGYKEFQETLAQRAKESRLQRDDTRKQSAITNSLNLLSTNTALKDRFMNIYGGSR